MFYLFFLHDDKPPLLAVFCRRRKPARFEDPCWEQLGERCLSCRLCAYVCPTCRCFDLRDEAQPTSTRERAGPYILASDVADPETGEVDWSTILPGLGIPEWQQDELVVADRVEAGFGERFIAIPHIESWEGYREADFSRLQQAIREAISLVANNQDPERGPRGGIRWTPRQFVRRVAWHTLDHAWEIEDRIVQSSPG